ncbi:MAG: type II toxin-antitoxin system VapB family antitoxin [Candidatus Schekmanbacteria bacterium]|nr:type II toxin-antitoxin system VapB family antitoxin [Candidatus Schekmanbacteria bacterium]
MRTNIVIDDELIQQAMKLSGLKTKREVVERGLRHIIRMGQKKELANLEGQVEFWPDYDYKNMRSNRFENKE